MACLERLLWRRGAHDFARRGAALAPVVAGQVTSPGADAVTEIVRNLGAWTTTRTGETIAALDGPDVLRLLQEALAAPDEHHNLWSPVIALAVNALPKISSMPSPMPRCGGCGRWSHRPGRVQHLARLSTQLPRC